MFKGIKVCVFGENAFEIHIVPKICPPPPETADPFRPWAADFLMKLPYAISLMTTILFVALGAASLLLDFTVRTLRIAVAEQEGQARLFETRISEQVHTTMGPCDEKEFQERENETLGRKIAQKLAAHREAAGPDYAVACRSPSRWGQTYFTTSPGFR